MNYSFSTCFLKIFLLQIRLTLRSRKLGVKRIPFVLAILQSIVLLLVFAIKSRKGSLVENRDLFLHGLAGTVCGMLITLVSYHSNIFVTFLT